MKVINGNNIDVLKEYPDNYFDAIVTDPPYGLGKEPDAVELMKDWIEHGYHEISGSGFMGKEWDAFVPQPLFWKEVYRVLKHGGHVVAFYGTRTYDWGVMAMRFAGFEVRDCIQWIYGSGFPKSHNISKAIDKMPKASDRLTEFAKLLKSKRLEHGLSILDADKLICNGSTMYNFLEGRNVDGVMKIYPPNETYYEKIKEHFDILGWDDIVENNLSKIGIENGNYGFQKDGQRWNEERDIKVHTTEQAKEWEGWGSALKPANEPIVLARKPLEKGLSIAENVLKWGTGGINIDGCRVSTDEKIENHSRGKESSISKGKYGDSKEQETFQTEGQKFGRFPANIILTHHPECVLKGLKKVKGSNCTPDDIGKGRESEVSDLGDIFKFKKSKVFSSHIDENGEETVEAWECHEDCPIKILDEQSGNSISRIGKERGTTKKGLFANSDFNKVGTEHNDSGGASRFFYCAKASKSERNNGLDGFEEVIKSDRKAIENIGANNPRNRSGEAKINHHPTVKPVKLMQYLVRMITPPKGKVLDPFCGSGTTGIACKLEGFDFVGIEQDAEYCKIAEARITNYVEEEEQPLEFIVEEKDGKTITQTSLF